MVQHLLMYIYFCQWTFWMGQNMDSFIYLLMMYKGPFNKNCYFLADQTMFCFLFSFQAVLAMFLFCSCVPHASAWYRYFLSTFEPVGCLVSILQVWQLMIYIYIYTIHPHHFNLLFCCWFQLAKPALFVSTWQSQFQVF